MDTKAPTIFFKPLRGELLAVHQWRAFSFSDDMQSSPTSSYCHHLLFLELFCLTPDVTGHTAYRKFLFYLIIYYFVFTQVVFDPNEFS